MGPLVVSTVYVALGLLYCFRWGPIVQHVPSLWLIPKDLPRTYIAATAMAHGHFGEIYQPGLGFLSYPGILLVLAPLGALSNAFRGSIVEIGINNHAVAHPAIFAVHNVNSLLLSKSPGFSYGREYVLHASVFAALIPFDLVTSCVVLFACDALAERLQVSRLRRSVLGAAEAAILWNITVPFGHPEDAVAVALAVYTLIFAMDERLSGAGWLFGAALAFQPLVIMMFPILLVMGGKKRALGLMVRGVIPAAVVTIPSLAGNFHDTVHTLVTQPTTPLANHETPWTFLAPKESTGANASVGAGPIRIAVLAVAAGVGWWARRWRQKPEMIAWALALALALRIFFEVVMTDYYVWPALAVGLVVGSRCSRFRFGASILIAILTTISAELRLAWLPWWVIDVTGVCVLLLVASRPEPLAPVGPRLASRREGDANEERARSRSEPAKKDKSGRARTTATDAKPDRAGSGNPASAGDG